MQNLTITTEIKTLSDVETRFKLSHNTDLSFFREWQDNLSELNQSEKDSLDRIKNSYLYNSADGALTEATINLLLISPLLYLAGFCDPPFRIRAEKTIEIRVEEREEIYRGRIDILVLQNQFWLALVESKQTKLSFSVAIPQALTYMMGNPNAEHPMFGLVTNGDNFLFLKLVKLPIAEYGFSTDFSVYGLPDNELYEVLKVMKRVGQAVGPDILEQTV